MKAEFKVSCAHFEEGKVGEEQKSGGGSFWTSLPGVLTGVAAVIGAVGALYVNTRSKPDPVPPAPVVKYEDELRVLSITPAFGTQLKHEPTTFKVNAHYSLGAADNAVLAVVAARFPQQAGGCKGTGWQADGNVRVPVKKGENDISIDVPWKASAEGRQGGLAEGGYVGIAARYITESMVEIKRLGPFPAYCFPVMMENAKVEGAAGNADPAPATGQVAPQPRRRPRPMAAAR